MVTGPDNPDADSPSARRDRDLKFHKIGELLNPEEAASLRKTPPAELQHARSVSSKKDLDLKIQDCLDQAAQCDRRAAMARDELVKRTFFRCRQGLARVGRRLLEF